MSWTWGERIHMVPQDFRFPYKNVHAKTLWNLWWSGNPSIHVGPYRKLQPFDLFHKADRNYLSKAKNVMAVLIHLAERLGVATEKELRHLEDNNRDKVFEKAFSRLTEILSPQTSSREDIQRRRFGDLGYLQLYDLIRESSKITSL